jgi:phage regulator Rha-like protein
MEKNINPFIKEIRGIQVMLDSDLARLYGIQTSRLNESVKRNIEKFPPEFMFQLTQVEFDNLISQIAISSYNYDEKNNKFIPSLKSQFVTSSWGGRRKLPFVFTEHGVVMLASVLNSPAAIKMNIAIVKSFINMRNYIAASAENIEIKDLKKVLMLHIDDTNHNFAEQADTINAIIEKLNLLTEHPRTSRKIGFKID